MPTLNEIQNISILPQQLLLLEVLKMSGDIAISDDIENSILLRTLGELQAQKWVEVINLYNGFLKASITKSGRDLVNSKLSALKETSQKLA